MRCLPIGELADKAHVRASALRYWEERGPLPGARREGGRRVWPATMLRRVALIKMAQRAGFTLAEITRLHERRPVRTPRHRGPGALTAHTRRPCDGPVPRRPQVCCAALTVMVWANTVCLAQNSTCFNTAHLHQS
ncbi:MerR family transcriptional regulator [Streptomyces sp. NPDC047813]|uniref:MerR family transcriptional regulator n=1 Tax=Streptomyces sp. NPDC047813 TaxID=3154608 RepID=UPI0034074C2C